MHWDIKDLIYSSGYILGGKNVGYRREINPIGGYMFYSDNFDNLQRSLYGCCDIFGTHPSPLVL